MAKKYFYVLRPLLALNWIHLGLGPVPMEFSRLVEAIVTDTQLRRAIDELVTAKVPRLKWIVDPHSDYQ